MSAEASRTVAFLGTGLMGAPMARALAEAGHSLRLWNRDRSKAEAVGTGTVCSSAAEAAAGADAVIVMLSSGPVCAEVLFGELQAPRGQGSAAPSGAVSAMAPGTTLVVMSSIGYEEARDMAARARRHNLHWVDAPVSGGTKGARDASLSIMAGGSEEDVTAVTPLLSAMGKVTHIGPEGTGALCKLINQMLVASTISAVAEGLFLATRGGADPAKIREALLGGFAGSVILQQHGARMVARDFAPGGPAKYQLKDTQAALAVAQDLRVDLPILKTADALFADLVVHGGADLDHSALLLELERRNPPSPDQKQETTSIPPTD